MTKEISILEESENFPKINFEYFDYKKNNCGSLLLLKIFTYSCMNCLRSLEFIKKIDKKYRKFGLKTIILHPFEFKFERDIGSIKNAVKKHSIKFPIIIDKNKRLIKKLGVDFWPADILIKNEKIIYSRIGEGSYKMLENNIIKHLNSAKNAHRLFSKEPNLSKIPAVYCGCKKKGIIKKYENSKSKIKFGIIYTEGIWKQNNECIKSSNKNRKINSVYILSKGKSVSVVAGLNGNKSAKLKIYINKHFHKSIKISGNDIYRIADFSNKKNHIVGLSTKGKIKIYSFAFE